MKILAYDVETANASRASVCAVGWVLVKNDQIIEKGGSLINPQCRFNPHNIAVHGITPKQVETAPTFPQYWESTLAPLMDKTLVVAYNANFDIGATRKAMEAAGLPTPFINYVDALPVIRRFVTADSYKLHDLAEWAGFSYKSHDPTEDAQALVRLLQFVAEKSGFDDVIELLVHSLVPVQNPLMETPPPQVAPVFDPAPEQEEKQENQFDGIALAEGSLSGLRICLTGDVPGVPREQIESMIVRCGGKPTGAVSGKTDYLVIGVYEAFGPGFVSSKQKKAMELIDQGAKIKVIDFSILAEMMKGLK